MVRAFFIYGTKLMDIISISLSNPYARPTRTLR